jgi:iron complex outermembrane receptor protein
MDGKIDRGQPIFGAIAGVTNLNSTPISFNLGATNDYFKSKEVIITGNIAHKLTDHISFNTAYMKQTWTEDLFEHRTTNAFAVDITNKPIATLAAMQAVQRQQFWNIDNINSYFNIEAKTGAISHKLLMGYDLHRWQKLKGGGQNTARGFVLKDGTTTNSFVVANASNYQTITVNGVVLPKPNVNHFDLTNPSYTIRNINEYGFTKTALPAALTTTDAVYVQEQLTWNKWMLLLSLRHEWFNDITNYESANSLTVEKTALLPRIGLTYALNKNINIYGTYLKGYQPQANTVTLLAVAAPAGSTFAPLESDLHEMGLKSTLFEGNLQVSAALYEINQRNLLMNANDPANPDLLVTRGAERSRGLEIDMAGYLLPNWQINIAYGYIDAIIVNDKEASFIGARKQNTPVHSGNLWTRYNFDSKSVLKDIGIGLGLQYSGSKIPWYTRVFEVPAYTLLDMALYYTPNKSNMQLALNVNNLTNETYWIGAQTYLRLFPGAPRSTMLTATYKF